MPAFTAHLLGLLNVPATPEKRKNPAALRAPEEWTLSLQPPDERTTELRAEEHTTIPATNSTMTDQVSSAGFAGAILLLGGGREEHAVRRGTTVGRGTKSPSEFSPSELRSVEEFFPDA